MLAAAGPSRMGARIDIEPEHGAGLAIGRPGDVLGPVGHDDLDLVVVGMDVFFHRVSRENSVGASVYLTRGCKTRQAHWRPPAPSGGERAETRTDQCWRDRFVNSPPEPRPAHLVAR